MTTRCEQELCPNWSGNGDVCPCAVFDLPRPRRCECERTDHPQRVDGKCLRLGDGAEQMTGGKVIASPALCIPCLFGCAEGDDDGEF